MGSFDKAFLKFQFNAKQRTRVYRKLNRFLGNSVTLANALDIMYGHASQDGKKPKAMLAVILNDWRRQVRNGKSFGQAIQGWVPDSDRLVIEGGEQAGNLAVAIEKAVMISSSSKKIKSTLISGLAYPFFLFSLAILFMALFGLKVVPTFDQILPRAQWTGLGAQMATLSDFVNNYLVGMLVFFAGLVVLIVITMPRWTGNLRSKFDNLPPWSLYRLVIGAGFMLTVSGMIKSGIPVPRILQMLQRGASPWYVEKLSRTLFQVNNGKNLGEALHKTNFNFPDKETVQDLRAYAALNKFDETLDNLGKEWLEESVEKVQAQTGILRMISFLFLGFVFSWIAAGMFSLQQQITSSL